MELSQCGAGGLLKARATMRVSHLMGPRRSVRSTVLAVAVAVGALVTLVSLPLPGRGIEYTGRASHISSVYDSIARAVYDYVGWRSVFRTECLWKSPDSARSASRGEVYRAIAV